MTNGGHTTKYFRLERGARKRDPISAHLFILVLEVLFIFITFNKNIDGINVFNHEYLYTAYADDATFFLKNQTSVKNALNDISSFLNFSGLRPNLDKCKIAWIGALKNVNVALCDMKNAKLTKESIKFFGVHICYNKKIRDDLNFTETIKNLCNVILYICYYVMTYEKTNFGRQSNNFWIISNLKNCALSDNNKSFKYCDRGVKASPRITTIDSKLRCFQYNILHNTLYSNQ